MEKTIGMLCVSYFLLSKMRKGKLLCSALQGQIKKISTSWQKIKGNAVWSFSFSRTNTLVLKSPIISHPCSHAIQVKDIFFSLDDILRTGCQAHLSPHLQLILVCMSYPHAVQFSGREQFVSFLQWVSFLRMCCPPTTWGAVTFTQNYGWSVFLKNKWNEYSIHANTQQLKTLCLALFSWAS